MDTPQTSDGLKSTIIKKGTHPASYEPAAYTPVKHYGALMSTDSVADRPGSSVF